MSFMLSGDSDSCCCWKAVLFYSYVNKQLDFMENVAFCESEMSCHLSLGFIWREICWLPQFSIKKIPKFGCGIWLITLIFMVIQSRTTFGLVWLDWANRSNSYKSRSLILNKQMTMLPLLMIVMWWSHGMADFFSHFNHLCSLCHMNIS